MTYRSGYRNSDSQLLSEAYTNAKQKEQLIEQIMALTANDARLIQEWGSFLNGLGNVAGNVWDGIKGAGAGLSNLVGKGLSGAGNVLGKAGNALSSVGKAEKPDNISLLSRRDEDPDYAALTKPVIDPLTAKTTPMGSMSQDYKNLPDAKPQAAIQQAVASAPPVVKDIVSQVMNNPAAASAPTQQVAQQAAQVAQAQGAAPVDIKQIIELINAIKSGSSSSPVSSAANAPSSSGAAGGTAGGVNESNPAEILSKVKQLLDQLDVPRLQGVLTQLQQISQQFNAVNKSAAPGAAPAAAPAGNNALGFDDWRKMNSIDRMRYSQDWQDYYNKSPWSKKA